MISNSLKQTRIMFNKRKSITVVYERVKLLLISLLFAMIGKSLDTNNFVDASWVFLALSLFFLGFRRVARFLPLKGKYDIGYRLFGLPLWVTHFNLDEVKAVKVEHKIIRSRKTSEANDHHYLISLIRVPSQKIKVIRNDSLKARLLGEKIARSIQCQLLDGSQDIVIRRTEDELDMSLGERLRHRGDEIENPDFPSSSRLRLISQGSELKLWLPPQPLPGVFVAFLLLFFSAIGGLSFLVERHFQVMILLFVSLCMLFILYAFFNTIQATILWITPDGVRYKKFPYRGLMPLGDLEEVIHKGPNVSLISDDKIMGLPYDFSREDGRYVRKLIEYMAYQTLC